MRITELFKIVEGDTSWFLTSADSNIAYSGDTYIATVMGRSEAESRTELSRSNMEIILNIDHEISQRHMSSIIDEVVSLTVFSAEDLDVAVTWKGRLAAIKPEGSKMKLIFESIYTSLRRPGLRDRFQRNCRHTLYGPRCKVDKDDFEESSTATAVTGSIVTCPEADAFEDGYFVSGMLKAPDGTFRFVVSHVGTQIGLARPIDSLTEAILGGTQNVKLYPGCDRTRAMCDSRFGNILNNGSFAFIPIRNPFGGSSFV
jgi:uncharacterized phage protein (TIGR02218 family)